jgi:undecaprenyl pyrophosphate synthase
MHSGRFLDAPDIADPDLIIRTSGEQRTVELSSLAGRL